VSAFLTPSEGKYPVFLRVLGFQARNEFSFEAYEATGSATASPIALNRRC